MSDQQPAQGPHEVPPHVSSAPPYAQQPGVQQPDVQQPGVQQPGTPGQYTYVAPQQPPGTTAANPAGRASLILGLVSIGLGILIDILIQVMIRTDGYMVVSVVSGVGSLLAFLTALAALIIGLIGIRRPGVPHVAAGIGAGIGIAGVLGIASSYLIGTVGSLLFF